MNRLELLVDLRWFVGRVVLYDTVRYKQSEAHDLSVDTYFCAASISKYFKSSSVCSGVFILTNVVAMPVFPLRPVRPI